MRNNILQSWASVLQNVTHTINQSPSCGTVFTVGEINRSGVNIKVAPYTIIPVIYLENLYFSLCNSKFCGTRNFGSQEGGTLSPGGCKGPTKL